MATGTVQERIVEAISRWHQKKTPLLDADKEFKVPARTRPRRRKTDLVEAAKAATAGRP